MSIAIKLLNEEIERQTIFLKAENDQEYILDIQCKINELKTAVENLALSGVTTRIFRFSGMNKNVKFVVNVKADNRETAIAYFETEHPKLTWRTTTEITDIT